MAAVPLVVVITTRRPLSFLNSSGEFPRSKPSGGNPPLSPANNKSGSFSLRARASSREPTGKIASTPEARPVMIEDVARKTSNTTAVTSVKSVAEILRISLGQRATWIIAFFGTSVASDETSIVVRNRHKNRNNRPQKPLTRATRLWCVRQNRPHSEPERSKHRLAPRPTAHRQTTGHN